MNRQTLAYRHRQTTDRSADRMDYRLVGRQCYGCSCRVEGVLNMWIDGWAVRWRQNLQA